MFYNNNFIDVVFKCQKGELPLNNILFEYTVLYKLMLLLCNLDMAICHIILVGNLTNMDSTKIPLFPQFYSAVSELYTE